MSKGSDVVKDFVLENDVIQLHDQSSLITYQQQGDHLLLTERTGDAIRQLLLENTELEAFEQIEPERLKGQVIQRLRISEGALELCPSPKVLQTIAMDSPVKSEPVHIEAPAPEPPAVPQVLKPKAMNSLEANASKAKRAFSAAGSKASKMLKRMGGKMSSNPAKAMGRWDSMSKMLFGDENASENRPPLDLRPAAQFERANRFIWGE